MSKYVLDTDILSLAQKQHGLVCQRIRSHPVQEVTLTVITIQEQIIGWQALLSRARTQPQIAAAYDRLPRLVLSWKDYLTLSFTEPAIQRYEHLLTLRLNVGRMDLRIAAIALENSAIVVTRNQRDFGRVPGLVIEDWSI